MGIFKLYSLRIECAPERVWQSPLLPVWALILLVLQPQSTKFLLDMLISNAHAYKVERVCEKVTTKRGTSEKCSTKLVRPETRGAEDERGQAGSKSTGKSSTNPSGGNSQKQKSD